jgi:hypothetical protein
MRQSPLNSKKKTPNFIGRPKTTVETNDPDIACFYQSTVVSDFALCITVERDCKGISPFS